MLRINKDFVIPDEAVTQTFAVLAKRGVGKTYLALVMAEEMLKANLQVVICDPIGVTWGLRASADGERPGLPILIFGGDHGDVPLEVGAGELIADLVTSKGVSVVLDLSRFRKGEQTRFMEAFCEALYHKNRSPLHLVLDEADAFAPQRPMPGQQRLLGAVEDLVRRGRARGIGVTLVTQRAAVLNKDVLTQVEVLVTLRTIAPQDRDAIDAWVKVHGTPAERESLMTSLPSLPIGTAWFWSPGWLNVFKRVEVRKRETYDSSSTPKVGEKRAEPRTLAPIDLERIRTEMAATIERAKLDDPASLRKRIAELEKQLAGRPPERIEVPVEVRVEVPVLPDAQLARLESRADDLQGVVKDLGQMVTELRTELARIKQPAAATPAPRMESRSARIEPVVERISAPVPRIKDAAPRIATDASRVTGPQQRILDALAWWEGIGIDAPTRLQVGFAAGYSARGGAFGNYLGALRTAGLLDYPSQGTVTLTDGGRATAQPLDLDHRLAALHEAVRAKLPRPQARILEAICAVYPNSITREDVGAAVEMAPTGGSFGNYLGALRSLGLIGYPAKGWVRAEDVLFPAGLHR